MVIKHQLLWLILVLFSLPNCNTPSVESISGDGIIAFTEVNVLPMTGNEVLDNQTVIVRNGKIDRVVPSGSLEIGDDVTIIESKGKYLLPGLSEMHAHIPVAQEDNDSLVRETLLLYLSGGITMIRGMLGNPYHLELRKAVAKGDILGPRVFTSSPSMNGNTVQTIGEAIERTT